MPVFEDEHRTPRAGAQCPRRENLTMKGYVETREITPDELLDTLIDVRGDVRGLAFNLHNMACYAGDGACIEGDTIDLLYASALLAYEALAQCVPLVEALLGEETTPQLIARFSGKAPPIHDGQHPEQKATQERETLPDSGGFLAYGFAPAGGVKRGAESTSDPLATKPRGLARCCNWPCVAVPIRKNRKP